MTSFFLLQYTLETSFISQKLQKFIAKKFSLKHIFKPNTINNTKDRKQYTNKVCNCMKNPFMTTYKNIGFKYINLHKS